MKLIVFTYLTLFIRKTAANHQDIASRPAQISRVTPKVWLAKYVHLCPLEQRGLGISN